MHSRIFQASFDPIDKSDYIEESNYWDHWFTNSVADYVNGDCNRNEDIEWFKNCVKGFEFGTDDNGEYFIVKNREEYFKSAFERFKSILDKIKDCTIKDFSEGIFEVWQLKNEYEEKYGFYIDVDGELMSLDSFVRLCATEEKYYIGATIDYHC